MKYFVMFFVFLASQAAFAGRYAVVKNNIVDNTIVWDGKTPLGFDNGIILVDLKDYVGVDIDCIYQPSDKSFLCDD